MIKFIIPAVIIFLIVLFWEKISEKIKERFNIQVNYIALALFLLVLGIIMALLYFQIMKNFDLTNYELKETDGVFTLKNVNTTIGFVRFNKLGEVEYIFVNPIFRKKGIAKRLLRLVKKKNKKKANIPKTNKSTWK